MSTGSDNHESGIMNEAGSFEHDEYNDENPIVSDSESVSEDDTTNLDIESPYVKAPKSNNFQASELAAAQMIHLMNNSSAYQALDNGVNIAGLDEKENIPVCKFCNKVFANFSNLNHHVNAIHLNQSKWVCSQCGKVCSSKSNLKVHLRVHLRVKPYHCRWCSYSCMHHSSIRDHLAKVHPDKSHTPLQPGYIFNSHAVPEPDVFNSNNFNLNNFVNDSKLKRSNEDQEQLTPEKVKKPRTSANHREEPKGFQPVNQKDSTSSTPTNANVSSPIAPNYNLNNPQQMSSIYNAYNMARMLPFMYPMHLQYAAAAAAAGNNPMQTQNQGFPSQLFRMVNNNMMQQLSTARPTPSFAGLNNNFSINTNFQSLYNNSYSTGTNSNPSNSFEEPTTSSNFSYSNSSRSASLSPSDKTSSESVSLVAKQMKNIVTTSETQTSTESKDEIDVKREQTYTDHIQMNPFSAGSMTTSSPTIATSSPKNTLTVDQILSNKSNKSTQTEPSCLKCPYCSNSAANN